MTAATGIHGVACVNTFLIRNCLGIPAVCFGPRDKAIHGIDERVSLRSMVEAAQVLALFICAWCNRGEER